jgi:tripartite-type tricarboxylate transporter receptor subunit TctC
MLFSYSEGQFMPLPRRRFLRLCAGGAALAAAPRFASAQNYPTRPIRLVVPFAPGGAYDTVGRPLADRLKPLLGTVIVENIGGGGSSLGAAAVAHARPDGYSILLGGSVPYVIEALLKNRPLYDPVKDLEPISRVARSALFIIVHPGLPVRDLKDLVAFDKSNPGKLSFGHVGIGSTNHLTGELFKSLTGTSDIVQVPYRGSGPAISDLLGAQLPMAIAAANAQLLELHRSGKLRVLAVTSPKRLSVAPDLPTAAEQGFPDLTYEGSYGLLVPTGTPKTIVAQIAQASRAAVADPAFQRLLIEAGYEADADSSPEQFRHALEQDVVHWTPIVKELALKLD